MERSMEFRVAKEDNPLDTAEFYEKPTIEIIEMELEGVVLAASGSDYDPGGGYSGW